MNPKWKKPRARRARRKLFRKRKAGRVLGKGGFLLTRKTNRCNVFSTTVPGVIGSAAGTGMSSAWITLGTPELINGLNYDVPFSMEFTMSDIIGYTDVTGIADQYKVNWVKVSMNYNSNSADVNGPASMPGVYYIQDSDDAGVTTVSQVRSRMGLKYKSWGSNRTHLSFVVKPKVAPLIYNGTGTSGYAIPLRTTWLNTLTPSVPHYGVRGYFTNLYLPGVKEQAVLINFDITYSISAKDLE